MDIDVPPGDPGPPHSPDLLYKRPSGRNRDIGHQLKTPSNSPERSHHAPGKRKTPTSEEHERSVRKEQNAVWKLGSRGVDAAHQSRSPFNPHHRTPREYEFTDWVICQRPDA